MLVHKRWRWFFIVVALYALMSRQATCNPVKTYVNYTVLLPCYVEDLGGIQTRVRWYRNDLLVADNEDPSLEKTTRVKMWGNSSLELLHAQPEDSGVYKCEVIRPDPWGQVTQTHQIQVMYPPIIRPIPESGEMELSMGEEADLSCMAKGVPTPTIAWRFENEELKLSSDQPRLRFVADNRSLAGRYFCTASNGLGEPAVAHIDLRIKFEPEVRAKKTWIHAALEYKTQLDCEVNAWPEARVEWYFRDKPISYSSHKLKSKKDENTHSLVIKAVRMSDFGEYTCRATNSLGQSEDQIELSGTPNPTIVKRDSRPLNEKTYSFIWEVDSYTPIIDYQFWFRPSRTRGKKKSREEWHKLFVPSGNVGVGPMHTSSFNLTGLDPSTIYEALVLSRNRFGWSLPSKIIRFSTQEIAGGINLNPDEGATETALEEIIEPSVIQIASMSHLSPPNGSTSRSTAICGSILLLAISLVTARHLVESS